MPGREEPCQEIQPGVRGRLQGSAEQAAVAEPQTPGGQEAHERKTTDQQERGAQGVPGADRRRRTGGVRTQERLLPAGRSLTPGGTEVAQFARPDGADGTNGPPTCRDGPPREQRHDGAAQVVPGAARGQAEQGEDTTQHSTKGGAQGGEREAPQRRVDQGGGHRGTSVLIPRGAAQLGRRPQPGPGRTTVVDERPRCDDHPFPGPPRPPAEVGVRPFAREQGGEPTQPVPQVATDEHSR